MHPELSRFITRIAMLALLITPAALRAQGAPPSVESLLGGFLEQRLVITGQRPTLNRCQTTTKGFVTASRATTLLQQRLLAGVDTSCLSHTRAGAVAIRVVPLFRIEEVSIGSDSATVTASYSGQECVDRREVATFLRSADWGVASFRFDAAHGHADCIGMTTKSGGQKPGARSGG